eukprot:4388315-Pyramimonas_sp.AAC.1
MHVNCFGFPRTRSKSNSPLKLIAVGLSFEPLRAQASSPPWAAGTCYAHRVQELRAEPRVRTHVDRPTTQANPPCSSHGAPGHPFHRRRGVPGR